MQYIFDIFWYRAIPADQKIQEIEEGIEHVETKVLESPDVKYSENNLVCGMLIT